MAVKDLTPSKKALQYNTEVHERIQNGILPQEGVEAFRRIIAYRAMSQVIVSTSDILARLRRAQSFLLAEAVGTGSAQGTIPTALRPNLPTPYVPPQNETQQQIATLWQKLLGIEKIGIHDNFMELGGHSLLGTQLIIRLRDTFQVDLSLRTLFEEPTVAGLALVIVQKKAELVNEVLLLQAIEDLEHLTDDEVQTLLTVDVNQTERGSKI